MANHNDRQWKDRSGKSGQGKSQSRVRQAAQQGRRDQRIQGTRNHHDSIHGSNGNNTAKRK